MVVESLTRQKEIYLNGFAGIPAAVPVSFNQLEHAARKKLSSQAYAYIAGGAGNESTLRANTQSFEKIKIVPRMLRDVSVRDTSIELFGQKINSPIPIFYEYRLLRFIDGMRINSTAVKIENFQKMACRRMIELYRE